MKDDETSPSFPNGKSDKQMIELAESPFGIHEALHTCSVLMDTFGLRVAEHPAVALRPAILAKAEDAIERMMDVYQALGALPEWHEDITPPNGDEVLEALEVPGKSLVDRLDQWESGLAERYPLWKIPDSKRLEVRCGDIRELRQAFPLLHCALSLLNSLGEKKGRCVAVKRDGALNWTITEPRSAEAMAFALETDEHPILERMSDALAGLCGDDLERAFVVAQDCLRAALAKEKRG